jgi:MFS family permease
VTSGLAFLPLTAVLVATSTFVQTRLLEPIGVKALVGGGMALGVVAMLLLTRLTPGAGYASHVLPALIVLGIGMGAIFAPTFSTATSGVARSEAGVASAMVNTAQQVGGSVGTALLSTIFASSVSSYAASHTRSPGLFAAATIHGYTTAFAWSAGIFGLGLLIALIVLPAKAGAPLEAPLGALEPAAPVTREPAGQLTPILATGPCCHFEVALCGAGRQIAAVAVGGSGAARSGANSNERRS